MARIQLWRFFSSQLRRRMQFSRPLWPLWTPTSHVPPSLLFQGWDYREFWGKWWLHHSRSWGWDANTRARGQLHSTNGLWMREKVKLRVWRRAAGERRWVSGKSSGKSLVVVNVAIVRWGGCSRAAYEYRSKLAWSWKCLDTAVFRTWSMRARFSFIAIAKVRIQERKPFFCNNSS